MVYVLSYYVLLPFMFIVVPGMMLACFFFCSGCEERRRQAESDERQMRVARELARHARREAAQAPHLVIIRDGRRTMA